MYDYGEACFSKKLVCRSIEYGFVTTVLNRKYNEEEILLHFSK